MFIRLTKQQHKQIAALRRSNKLPSPQAAIAYALDVAIEFEPERPERSKQAPKSTEDEGAAAAENAEQ